jgi:glycosyltransferase involved in cell wall biosynthesis
MAKMTPRRIYFALDKRRARLKAKIAMRSSDFKGLPKPTQVSYEPWRTSLEDRLSDLRREKFRVAYVSDNPDPAIFRYRGYTMAQAINSSVVGASATCFWVDNGAALEDAIREVDALVLCRSQYSSRLAGLVNIARAAGAKIFFDVDDLVFDRLAVPEVVRDIDALADTRYLEDAIWNFWYSFTGRIRALMELADEVIVTNEFLAGQVSERTGMPVSVIPNFMSLEQEHYSRELVAARERLSGPVGDAFHIGYFSGTRSHRKDLAIAIPGLCEVLAARPHVRLRLVGYFDVSETPLQQFASRIDRLPLLDYLSLQRAIAATEINIAPLQETVFTNCKSELKYFDAGAVAVPTLASPTFTMARAIRDGENGRLVDADQWGEALLNLVDDYSEVGSTLGKKAYDDVFRHFVVGKQARTIESVLGLAG